MLSLMYASIAFDLLQIANNFQYPSSWTIQTINASYPPNEDKRTTSEKLLDNKDDKYLHLIFTTWLNVFYPCYEGFFSLQLYKRFHIETLSL